MLQSENKLLLKNIKTINKATQTIFYLLNDLLDRSSKDYVVKFGERTFIFTPPTDKQDEDDNAHTRLALIELLLQDCFKAYIKCMPVLNEKELTDIFSPLLAFTMGADPKDFQLETIDEKEVDVMVDKDGNMIKSLPLDMDSPYVQADLKGDHVTQS